MTKKWTSFFQKLSNKFKKNQAPPKPSEPVTSNESATKALLSLNWNGFITNIFSPEKRPKIHRLFLLGLLGTSSYQLGKIGAILLENKFIPAQSKVLQKIPMVSKAPNTRLQIQAITSNNLFNAKTGKEQAKKNIAKKKDTEVLICEDASKSTTLPIKLQNTVVLQDRVKSIAAVQVRNKPLTIREGEKIQNMAEVSKITRMKLIFKNLKTRQCEYLENKDGKFEKMISKKKIQVVSPKKGNKLIKQSKNDDIKVEGNKFKIKKSLRDKLLAGGITELLTQAKAIPIRNPDGTFSFKMTEIAPGSLFTHLDVQDGDLFKQIDGKSITNIAEVTSMLGRLSKIDNINITIERNGVEQTKEFSFE